MFKVYLLQSIPWPKKSYIGKTIKPIEKRLEEHNLGLTQSTKAYRPWKLVYYEIFYCETCADKREIFLKSGIGYRLRRILLEHFQP